MTNFMKTALVSTALVAGSAAAIAATDIRSVDVEVDLQAIKNEDAAVYWSDVAGDLEDAIVARLTDQIKENEGASVSVDIDELSLATAFEAAYDLEKTNLIGDVSVTDLQDNSAKQDFELTVTYLQAVEFFPGNGELVEFNMENKDYYDGMIAAFADRVAERLQDS